MIDLRKHAVPGMSLTTEPGNRPWEQPPQFVTLDQVVAYYTEKLTTEQSVDVVLQAMEANVSLMSLARTLIKTGIMKGIHSVDVGFVALPILIELMKTIGDMNNMGYTVEDEDFEAATEIDEATAKEVLQQAVAEVKQAPAVKQAAGLMARE